MRSKSQVRGWSSSNISKKPSLRTGPTSWIEFHSWDLMFKSKVPSLCPRTSLRSKGQVQNPGPNLRFHMQSPGPEFEDKVFKSTTYQVKVWVQSPCSFPKPRSNISIQDQMQTHTLHSGPKGRPKFKIFSVQVWGPRYNPNIKVHV